MATIAISELNFNAKSYLKGVKLSEKNGIQESTDDVTFFWQCFNHWRKNYLLSDEQVARYISKIEEFIDKRVNAIVSGQFRRHYQEVAALVAALGEVKEFRGEAHGKAHLLKKYYAEFPRYRAFRSELGEMA